MADQGMPVFPLVDQYLSVCLGTDLSKLSEEEPVVVESDRRIRREESYGYIRALVGINFQDGRTVLSVPPQESGEISAILRRVGFRYRYYADWLEPMVVAVNNAFGRLGLPVVRNISEAIYFVCNDALPRRRAAGEVRRLVDDGIPPVDGLDLPTQCFPDGIAYGIVEEERIVSVAFAHRTGIMEDKVSDLGVETAKNHRRRGYAKTAVSAVTDHVVRAGGECLYKCSPDNRASIATATSVGYRFYAKAITFAVDVPKTEGHDSGTSDRMPG